MDGGPGGVCIPPAVAHDEIFPSALYIQIPAVYHGFLCPAEFDNLQ